MSIKAQQYYMITCDYPECKETVPHKDSGISAWAEAETALDQAWNEGWLSFEGEHFCSDHICFCEICEEILIPWTKPDHLCDDCGSRKEASKSKGNVSV